MKKLFTIYSQFISFKGIKGFGKEKKVLLKKLLSINNKHFDGDKFSEYLFNVAESCFGEHIIYLYLVCINDKEYCLKYGYSKNDVRNFDGRFDKVAIIEEICCVFLPAKGAVELEKDLEYLIPEHFRYTTEAKFPGKGELIHVDYKDEMKEMINELAPKYLDVVGLKSPN